MAESTESPLLDVADLTKTFHVEGQVLHAVDGVSLSIRRGETVGLVGESGSGKSTFGRAVVRLEDPDSGTIRFDGSDITRLGPRAMRDVHKSLQMVFQNPATCLNPLRRISTTLDEPLRLHGWKDRTARRDHIGATLERVGLPVEHLDRYPHELSGGQRQRVAVARALVLGPKLIVADEPTSALDLSVQAQIVNLLLSLQEQDGLGYLFISHDLGVVKHLSHRIAVLYLGRIVEVGPAEDVLGETLHPYTAALVSGTGSGGRHGRIRLEGEIPSPIDRPQGCAFRTRCPVARAACADAVPPLTPVGQDHHVACIDPGALKIGTPARRRPIAAAGAVDIAANPYRNGGQAS